MSAALGPALALLLAGPVTAQVPGALGVEGVLLELTEARAVVSRAEGTVDLNGDGDMDDAVPWILSRRTGHAVTLPYAVSGMGKTSLLNAGVMQGLRDRSYWPVSVRLNDPTISPVTEIREQIESAASADDDIDLASIA